MEEIRSLEHTSFDELFAAWEDAFSEYERTWSRDELAQMLERRGYTSAISFGAFVNGRLVSFILNSEGYVDGVKTAYDTGTGTVKAYRGSGLVKKLFAASIPSLKQRGTRQYLLEVLQHNTTAVKLYKSEGFEVHRSLDYFVQSMDKLQLSTKGLPAQFKIADTGFDRKEEMMAMWEFAPSWQNSLDSVARMKQDIILKAAFEGKKLAGYGIIEPSSGDITQLAVGRAYRRMGIGTNILGALLKHNRHPKMKIINTETDHRPMIAFLSYNGIAITGQQYEMVKKLA